MQGCTERNLWRSVTPPPHSSVHNGWQQSPKRFLKMLTAFFFFGMGLPIRLWGGGGALRNTLPSIFFMSACILHYYQWHVNCCRLAGGNISPASQTHGTLKDITAWRRGRHTAGEVKLQQQEMHTFSYIFCNKGIVPLKIEISPIYHPAQCRWRLWWHFLIPVTPLEFNGGKELNPVESCCCQILQHKKTTKQQQMMSLTWLHTACLVSSTCLEDAAVKFLSKWRR